MGLFQENRLKKFIKNIGRDLRVAFLVIILFFIVGFPTKIMDRVIERVIDKYIIDKTVELGKFVPDLTLETLEVCFKLEDTKFKCILTQCLSGESDKHCERYITSSEAIHSVQLGKAVIVPTRGWSRFIHTIEAYCEHKEINCERIYEDYSDIDKVIIIK